MSTAELLELAALDVAGVLDERERQRFERGFAAASPHVQAHVRGEQHRATSLGELLPDVEPPATLRGRVLRTVRQAMAEQRFESELADTLQADSGRRRGLLNTLPIWRAAAIACGTAALVLGGFALQVNSEVHRLASYVQNNQLLDFFRSSPRLQDIMFADRMQRFAMLPLAPDYNPEGGAAPQASLVFDPEQNVAVLLCRGLTSGSEYRLVETGADGAIEEDHRRIQVSGGVAQVTITGIDAQVAPRLGISAHTHATDPGEVVLSVSPTRGDG